MTVSFASKGSRLLKWAGVVQKASVKALLVKDEFVGLSVNQVIPFCFPTDEPISGPLSYVFRFRTSSEVFYNVFCLLDQTSFQLRDMDTNQQCCICIVSEHYHFDVFDEALKIARSLLLHNVSSAEHFFETLYSNPNSLTIMQTLPKLFTTSEEALLSQLISPLTSRFDNQTIGEIVLALLADTPFIVTSNNLSQLTQACYALSALVHPFEWRHIFAPVLPVNIIETVQSPAPFIVGVHYFLLGKLSAPDIEAHVRIDIDKNQIDHVNMQQMPQWALQLCSSLKDTQVNSIHQLMIRIICSSLGVHPSSSPSTTSRRLLSAAKASKFEPGSIVFQLVNSRTCRCLFDALKEKPIPAKFMTFLGSCINSGITSPAAQDVDEFPLRKVQVLRSNSVQFNKDNQRRQSISNSNPALRDEIKQSQSMLLPHEM